MYAIVDIAGQQYKVEKDQKLFVHRLDSEIGSQVDFDKVLLIDNDSSVVVGVPVIEGAMISAKILEHLKGDKVIVFKKKRRKGYKVKNGHRQFFTQIQVEDIIESGAEPKASKSKQSKPVVKKETSTETVVAENESGNAEIATAKTSKPKAEAKVEGEKKEKTTKTVAKKATSPKKPDAEKPTKKPAAAKKPKQADTDNNNNLKKI